MEQLTTFMLPLPPQVPIDTHDLFPDAPATSDNAPQEIGQRLTARNAEPSQTRLSVQPELGVADDSGRAVVTMDEGSGGLGVVVGGTSLSLPAAVESLLFVADGAVEAAELARVFNLGADVIQQALQELDDLYRETGRGLRVQVRGERYQLVTLPAAAPLIEAFLNLDTTTRLSGPALETLAVVAYRQPVTRSQVEAVRGVDCSGVLRSLMQRRLIEETGRMDAPGRPVLYGVTDLFMQHFGIIGLHELPPLETGEAVRLDEVIDITE